MTIIELQTQLFKFLVAVQSMLNCIELDFCPSNRTGAVDGNHCNSNKMSQGQCPRVLVSQKVITSNITFPLVSVSRLLDRFQIALRLALLPGKIPRKKAL